jgi:co-chaperonin GroES (HSP10)
MIKIRIFKKDYGSIEVPDQYKEDSDWGEILELGGALDYYPSDIQNLKVGDHIQFKKGGMTRLEDDEAIIDYTKVMMKKSVRRL